MSEALVCLGWKLCWGRIGVLGRIAAVLKPDVRVQERSLVALEKARRREDDCEFIVMRGTQHCSPSLTLSFRGEFQCTRRVIATLHRHSLILRSYHDDGGDDDSIHGEDGRSLAVLDDGWRDHDAIDARYIRSCGRRGQIHPLVLKAVSSGTFPPRSNLEDSDYPGAHTPPMLEVRRSS